MKRLVDLAIYVAVALAIGLTIVWYAYHTGSGHGDTITRWGGLGLNTAILFGYVIKESRPFWHVWEFWIATLSVLILHLLLFSILLHRVEHWSVLWFLLMYPVEIPVLAIFCDWAVHTSGKQPSHKGARKG